MNSRRFEILLWFGTAVIIVWGLCALYFGSYLLRKGAGTEIWLCAHYLIWSGCDMSTCEMRHTTLRHTKTRPHLHSYASWSPFK